MGGVNDSAVSCQYKCAGDRWPLNAPAIVTVSIPLCLELTSSRIGHVAPGVAPIRRGQHQNLFVSWSLIAWLVDDLGANRKSIVAIQEFNLLDSCFGRKICLSFPCIPALRGSEDL